MNLEMFNISKSCFGVYSLFFFSFGGFDLFDILFFLCTFDIQILLDNAMYYELIHKHYKEMS